MITVSQKYPGFISIEIYKIMVFWIFSAPMDIAEQIVVIFCGVRGFLDKVDPTRVTEYEEKFLIHMRTNHAGLVETIR